MTRKMVLALLAYVVAVAAIVGVAVYLYLAFFFNYITVDEREGVTRVRYGAMCARQSEFIYTTGRGPRTLAIYDGDDMVDIFIENDGQVRSYSYYRRGVGRMRAMCPAGERCSWVTETWTVYNNMFDLQGYDR